MLRCFTATIILTKKFIKAKFLNQLHGLATLIMTTSGLRLTNKSYAKLGLANVGGSYMDRAIQDVGLILKKQKPTKESIHHILSRLQTFQHRT